MLMGVKSGTSSPAGEHLRFLRRPDRTGPSKTSPQPRPWTAGEKLVILMTMSEVSSLAEAKAHLSELVARVGEQHERITVTVHGRPTAVLLAVDDLESLEETIAVLSDSAALRALGEADAELARGEGENQESLAAAMQARRART
jgi:antitoxin YefM